MRPEPARTVPSVPGVLTAAQVAESAASIEAMQEPDGAIPWTTGAHTDVWNHLESAMGLLVGGRPAAAERAFDWALATQRADGSWPMKLVAGEVEDASGETNMSAYLAVALWHHWLVRRDAAFVARCWPTVRRALDWVVSVQLPFGGIAWAQEWVDGRPGIVHQDALLAASSSVHQSLRAGVSLAELMDDPQPEWELAGGRLRHALRAHPDLFLDKSEFSMDWYYPVLGGAVRGRDGRARCWPTAGTSSWCPTSASAASRPTRGSPAPRPASWCWPSRRSATASGPGGCSPTCSICVTTRAATGPATSGPTT